MTLLDSSSTVKKHDELAFHEWLALLVILISLGFIFCISMYESWQDRKISYSTANALITVIIEGAVLNPGPVQIRADATADEIFELIQWHPDADRTKIKIPKHLKNGQKITIATIKKKKRRKIDKDFDK